MAPRQTETDVFLESPETSNPNKNSSPMANDTIKQQSLTFQSSNNVKSLDKTVPDKFNIPNKK